MLKIKLLLFLSLFISFSTIAQKQDKKKKEFHYAGRIENISENKIILIGSASSVSFKFKGDSCSIRLMSGEKNHNYFSVELDGADIGRFRLEKDIPQDFPIVANVKKRIHTLTIYKATEASIGDVQFLGTTAKLKKSKTSNKKKIEFIGDSITCGFGNDTTFVSCSKGEWFDQHNAYWAYGPLVSRAIDASYVLSSVSGYGMYRNWNAENEPVIPEVYENLYLNEDTTKPYDFSFQPDLVSICLGTNDLSNGDGKKARLPFDEEKFVSNYIEFIKTVYKHAPNCRIVLLSSPMVSRENNEILVRSLKKVINAYKDDTTHKPIALFEFEPMQPKGCGAHPDISDDIKMAEQLTPFFNKLLAEK